MTEEVKRALLSSMTDETDADTLSAYLELARLEVLNRLYPFQKNHEGAQIPSRYDAVQIRIAAYHLNKRGAEGESQHTENGITRIYEAGDTPPSLYREIVPFASLPLEEDADEDSETE